MNVHLIRHAQSQANVNQVIAGQADSPLTPTGRDQATALQANIPDYDAVYSSPLQRAVSTARHALGKDDSIIMIDGLMERDWGDLVGKDYTRFRQLRTDPKMLATYSFESDEDFYERIRTTFDYIISDATNKHYTSILIFTHW